MTFKTLHKPISFSRTTATIKHWVIGWTVDESVRAAIQPSQSVEKQYTCPGTYGLLVSTERR